MTRDQALTLLKEYTQSESLLRHAMAVEAAMAAYAQKDGEDVEAWRVCGLLHDFDYERFPDAHPFQGQEILAAKGISEEIRLAILGHASDQPRESRMARTLFAVDELCGFLIACALVRPDKSLSQIQAKSVNKKLKDKRFAAQVNREEIRKGAEELGVEFNAHAEFVAQSLSRIAQELGLQP